MGAPEAREARGLSPDVLADSGWPACPGTAHLLRRPCHFAKPACNGHFGQGMQGCSLQRGEAEAALGPRAAHLGSQAPVAAGQAWLDVGAEEPLAAVGRAGFTQATPTVTFGLGQSHGCKVNSAPYSCPQHISRRCRGRSGSCGRPSQLWSHLTVLLLQEKLRAWPCCHDDTGTV